MAYNPIPVPHDYRGVESISKACTPEKPEEDIFAPVLGKGCFSDTDVVRCKKVTALDQIVRDEKLDYPFKIAFMSGSLFPD